MLLALGGGGFNQSLREPLVEGLGHAAPDAVEDDLHVLDAVDRYTRVADIALDAAVIGNIPAIRGKVDGDRDVLLTGGEVSAVEGVGFLRGREAGIVPDRPRAAGIHGRARIAHEWLKPGQEERWACR